MPATIDQIVRAAKEAMKKDSGEAEVGLEEPSVEVLAELIAREFEELNR